MFPEKTENSQQKADNKLAHTSAQISWKPLMVKMQRGEAQLNKICQTPTHRGSKGNFTASGTPMISSKWGVFKKLRPVSSNGESKSIKLQSGVKGDLKLSGIKRKLFLAKIYRKSDRPDPKLKLISSFWTADKASNL